MKLLKIIGHPVFVMCVFLLILISGESLGGFYLLYILLGILHGAPHALLAVIGLCMLFIGYKFWSTKSAIIKPCLYILGIAVMVLALVVFFERSKGYNDGTFSQTIPIISLVVFSLCAFCCLINSFIMLTRGLKNKQDRISILS